MYSQEFTAEICLIRFIFDSSRSLSSLASAPLYRRFLGFVFFFCFSSFHKRHTKIPSVYHSFSFILFVCSFRRSVQLASAKWIRATNLGQYFTKRFHIRLVQFVHKIRVATQEIVKRLQQLVPRQRLQWSAQWLRLTRRSKHHRRYQSWSCSNALCRSTRLHIIRLLRKTNEPLLHRLNALERLIN